MTLLVDFYGSTSAASNDNSFQHSNGRFMGDVMAQVLSTALYFQQKHLVAQ